MNLKTLDRRICVITLLLILTAYGIWQLGPTTTLPQVLVCVVAAVALDLLITKWREKIWYKPFSGIITGLIFAGVLTTGLPIYIAFIGIVIAILSKHFIHIQKRHIFNPANFGLVIIALIFPQALHSWWISTMVADITTLTVQNIAQLAVFFAFALYILISKLKKTQFLISFAVFYSLVLFIANVVANKSLPNIYLELGSILFFMFVMMVEPVTSSPATRNKAFAYALVIALLAVGFRFVNPGFNVVWALFIGNLLLPFINKYFKF